MDSEPYRPSRLTTLSEYERIWTAATALIAERFAEPLTVDQVAREVFTSRRQLQRVFALNGHEFRDYVLRTRMRHAAALLQATELPIERICRRVGYRQAAHLARAFRRVQGVSPTQYRRTSRVRQAA